MNNRSTPTRTGLTLAAILIVALAASAQQYIEYLKIGGGYGATGTTLEADGDVLANGSVTADGDLILKERADHASTPGAGYGYLWVKNDAPSVLVYTNDVGTDITLGAAGGGITDGSSLATGLTFPNTGLHLLDSNATHDLILKPGSNLTADRELTITTGDAARTVTLSGDTTLSGTNTGDQTITLTGDVTGTGTGTFGTTIAAGAVDIAMLSATGTPSGTTYLRGDNTWATVSGSGDVVKVGTPVDGQIGVWTGDGTIEGDAGLTFDTTDDTLVIAASGKLGFGAVDILSDSAGTTTLQNIDALDATTEATIEAAIDTLANLTSIQGQTVTVSGTTTISGTNTGDQTITLTGDVTGTGTGSFAASIDKTAITGKTLTTLVGGDSILFSDASDSGNLKEGVVSDLVLSVASTDNAIARFDSTAGQIQNSVVTIADTSGNMAGVGTLNTHTIPGGTGTLALTSDITVTASSTNTLTNKRISARTGTTTSSATPTINTDNYDLYIITAQAADITSMTSGLSGTPATGDYIDIWITGTGARAITWGASWASGAATLPTTTITTKTLYTRAVWDGSIWRCMATGSNP